MESIGALCVFYKRRCPADNQIKKVLIFRLGKKDFKKNKDFRQIMTLTLLIHNLHKQKIRSKNGTRNISDSKNPGDLGSSTIGMQMILVIRGRKVYSRLLSVVKTN